MCKATDGAPPAAPRDAIQTLISVNTIDQTVFAASDAAAGDKYWSKTFIDNTISQNLHDFIGAHCGGSTAIRDSVS